MNSTLKTLNGAQALNVYQPSLHRPTQESRSFRNVSGVSTGLTYNACVESCQLLTQLLADSQILFGLYKKHHWIMCGHAFYQLHLLFDKHAIEQLTLIDAIAERIQELGGVAIGDLRHAAEVTQIVRPPNGAEDVSVMIGRLLDAHATIIRGIHNTIERTHDNGDMGTNDLLMDDILRTHERQVWLLARV